MHRAIGLPASLAIVIACASQLAIVAARSAPCVRRPLHYDTTRSYNTFPMPTPPPPLRRSKSAVACRLTSKAQSALAGCCGPASVWAGQLRPLLICAASGLPVQSAHPSVLCWPFTLKARCAHRRGPAQVEAPQYAYVGPPAPRAQLDHRVLPLDICTPALGQSAQGICQHNQLCAALM